MDYDTAYRLKTASGWINFMFMFVETTIVAYREDEGVMTHQITDTGPLDDDDRRRWFGCIVSPGPVAVVGRLRHPTDTLIGFYFAEWTGWPEWADWGYVWNVDHPERSYWAPTTELAAAVELEDLERNEGPLERMTKVLLEFTVLLDVMPQGSPRAAALLTAERYRQSKYGQLADAIPKVTQKIEWMQDYRAGLIDCLAREEVQS